MKSQIQLDRLLAKRRALDEEIAATRTKVKLEKDRAILSAIKESALHALQQDQLQEVLESLKKSGGPK